MDSVKEFMFTTVGALLFVVAVTLFMTFSNRVYELSDAVESTDSIDTSLASVSDAEYSEPVVTYADVVSELFTDTLQYDVEINGILYSRDEYNLARYDVSGLTETATYRRACVYDADGVLKKVIYWSN